MPDLKSELSKVLQAWDAPTQPTETATMTQIKAHPRVTTNTTRRTFEYIANHPGNSRATVIAALEREGISSNSTRSLLSTFVIHGNVRETNGALFVNQREYKPIARSTVPRKARKARKAPEAPVQDPTPVSVSVTSPLPPTARFTATVQQLLDSLSIIQARELYDELRKIFGG